MADDRPRLVTALASAIKAAREGKGWSQRRLADQVAESGHELSSAYVGLIEAGHRLPTEAVVRALARVLERDADEWITLRAEAETDKRLVEMARHIDPAAFAAVNRALTQMRTTLDTKIRDIDPSVLAKGAERMQAFLERHGQTPMGEVRRQGEAPDLGGASSEEASSAVVAGGVAWLSWRGGPRRGRRYELATKLFELVADLEADQIQRVIGYTEAVRDDRRSATADPSD
jgi:transcriptional regulator with XRE-family HTH domain